jgi:hypothetical protein
MKLRTKVAAATVTLGLLGGATVATAESPSAGLAPRRSVELAAAGQRLAGSSTSASVSQAGVAEASANSALSVGRVGLRAVRQCTFRGVPTRCVIKVRRLERREHRVIAFGVIRPVNSTVAIPFQKRVIGVRTIDGIFDIQSLQQAPSCDILSLVLGPLHLDVLGLVIDLNRVVLNITGETGAGNLLGNLLCGLAGILDGGFILGRFLSVVDELLTAIKAVLALECLDRQPTTVAGRALADGSRSATPLGLPTTVGRSDGG